MIPGHLWQPAVKTDDVQVPPRGFEYLCGPCEIRGWTEAETAEDVRCWSCELPPTSTRSTVGVHGKERTMPDVEDGSPDRALWI